MTRYWRVNAPHNQTIRECALANLSRRGHEAARGEPIIGHVERGGARIPTLASAMASWRRSPRREL